ncbi:MAG: DUF4185 domain-containing protein [Melioribacteraceae bacterium]|nr:DUF4185 domain-containing protein [Melioribacteraceae bacterium]
MRKVILTLLLVMVIFILNGCNNKLSVVPTGVEFKTETIKRIGLKGDNWCITWLKDGSQMTSMDDGNWLNRDVMYHHTVYRIIGNAEDFTIEDIPSYPQFTWAGGGWFGYGIYSVNGNIYSMVSRTQGTWWSGPFRGIKMLKSSDNGENWYRVNRDGEERLLEPFDSLSREDLTKAEMFSFEEFGQTRDSIAAYPFSYCTFVQNGQDNNAAKDEYVYIYSPEGAHANRLLLARVNNKEIEQRDKWEYFSGWDGDKPNWTSDISKRGTVYDYPEKNRNDEYFGWYSWLPSVVWNEGLNLYIMVNGGTYGGKGMTKGDEDYYHSWMHTKTGSLGFWYSENPYGPWTQFYYTDYWIAENEKELTYQPKLSPKWISDDGKKMILIWSDAMKNEKGRAHTINYLWNHMEINIQLQ